MYGSQTVIILPRDDHSPACRSGMLHLILLILVPHKLGFCFGIQSRVSLFLRAFRSGSAATPQLESLFPDSLESVLLGLEMEVVGPSYRTRWLEAMWGA
jgi:hypothetical protein